MNQAKNKETGELVDAEDLRYLPDPKKIEFVCAGSNCGIPVHPCSYLPNNKPRPYFKVRGVEHKPECSYSSFLEYLKKGGIGRLSSAELTKMEFPSKLKVYEKPNKDENPQIRSEEENSNEQEGSKRAFSDEFSDEKKSNKVVSSINQIVDFYLSCPYNRDVPLDLLGTKKEYTELFQHVQSSHLVPSNELRIFYGKVNFKRGEKSFRNVDNQFYEFQLYEKKYVQDEPWESWPNFKVLIDRNKISNNKLQRIRYERQQVVEEKIMNHKKNEEREAYIFFLASKPNISTPYLFEAIHGMIVSRYTIIKPTILD